VRAWANEGGQGKIGGVGRGDEGGLEEGWRGRERG